MKKSGSRFHFRRTASNGEIILSSQRYTRPASAEVGVTSVKTNAPLDERYERRWARNGQRYFVLKAGNDEMIGTSEMYASDAGMGRGIASVKRNAPRAGVEAETERDLVGLASGLGLGRNRWKRELTGLAPQSDTGT